MRTNPSAKVMRTEEEKQAIKLRIQKITRLVALALALFSTYFFFIKIIFL